MVGTGGQVAFKILNVIIINMAAINLDEFYGELYVFCASPATLAHKDSFMSWMKTNMGRLSFETSFPRVRFF
jgi:hypothetical protein